MNLLHLSLLTACSPTGKARQDSPDAETASETASSVETGDSGDSGTEDCQSTLGASLGDAISDHFQVWLETSPQAAEDLARIDIDGGSFGGLVDGTDCLANPPMVFVHGIGDRALGGDFGGWTASTDHFLASGYRQAELYATTWGSADPTQSGLQTHSRDNVLRVRRFIEAVLGYTGAERIDIISHSMGVTLSRRAVLGGTAYDANGEYDIGEPLTDRVDGFIGIAGGNRGIASCYLNPLLPTCDAITGFFPGHYINGVIVEESRFLAELNAQSGYEGERRHSIWSSFDEVIGAACIVWDENTCGIPGQTGEREFSEMEYGHLEVRDLTAAEQLELVE
jgi:hypothetical protein